MSAVLFPVGHPVRRILTMAAVPAYFNHDAHLSEALELPDFAVDLLKEVQATIKSIHTDGSSVTIQDPLSDARIALVNDNLLIDTQNSLVDEYIRTSPLTQLSRALKIQKLATQYMLLAKIIKGENYYLDKAEEKRYEDLTLLRVYLQQLISA